MSLDYFHIRYYCLLELLFCSSFLYLSKVILSPVYFLLPLCIFFSCFRSNYLKISIRSFLLSLAIFSLMVFHLLNFKNEYIYPIVLNGVVSSLIVFFAHNIFYRVTSVDIEKIVRHGLFFLFLLYCIDFSWKINNPLLNPLYDIADSDIWFYKFKNSLMFGDSNGVAILLLCFIGLIFSLQSTKKTQFNMLFLSIIFFILIAATFSRSALFSYVLLIICWCYRQLSFVYRFILVFPIFIISIYIISFALEYVAKDGSGGTKLNEIFAILKFISTANTLELFTGFGIGNGDSITGRYVHGLIPKLIVETGILGFIIIISYFFNSLLNNRNLIWFLIPFFVSSLSLSTYIIVPFVILFIEIANAYNRAVSHEYINSFVFLQSRKYS